ncbi:putative nTP pyrophosphohydrolase [Rhodococcus sp. MTM3W5.2]|nr:putative nTP pyrophosphohydrolase [Rhodococcus sp. MTM3W5.2]
MPGGGEPRTQGVSTSARPRRVAEASLRSRARRSASGVGETTSTQLTDARGTACRSAGVGFGAGPAGQLVLIGCLLPNVRIAVAATRGDEAGTATARTRACVRSAKRRRADSWSTASTAPRRAVRRADRSDRPAGTAALVTAQGAHRAGRDRRADGDA